jgi:hypothetical protein
LLVFYIARRWLIAHYEAKYAGFWGGVDALSNSDEYEFAQQIVHWATVAYAIAWVVLLYFVAAWIY